MTPDSAPDPAPFLAARGRLVGLAYRMLGSRAEAEDAVQDAWLRYAGARDLQNPEAFLVTTVTRLCLDRMKSARARREIYVGPWLPEPVVDADALSPEAATELADDLSFALMLALERLTPAERAAFLLHDVFGAPFSEVARTLEKSEDACRQLAARARRAVREIRGTASAAPEEHQRLLAAFLAALASGDVGALSALLREDAVLLTDGGGKKIAALNPVRGSDRIARFFIGLLAKTARNGAALSAAPARINGTDALLLFLNGEMDQTLSLDVQDGRIAAVYCIRNPEKLSRIPQLPNL